VEECSPRAGNVGGGGNDDADDVVGVGVVGVVLCCVVLCCVVLCCVAYKSTAEDGLCIGEMDYLPYVKERVHVQYSRYGRDRIRVFYV
jgi:hypothetical protein